MKELIIFNIILLVIYFFFSYKLLAESDGNVFASKSIVKMLIILIMPLIMCFLNQLFILFWGIDRIYVWFTFLYIIPPVIESVSTFIKNYNSEKFYKKYHNEIVNFINEYLDNSNVKTEDISILVALDTNSKQLGVHRIILKNLKSEDLFIKNLRQELFYKFHLDFDIFYQNERNTPTSIYR